MALCAGLSACAVSSPRPPPSLERIWAQYQDLPAERALAVAGDPELRWVAGMASAPSPEQAERRALAECRRRRLAQRMQDPCRLYARGDQIVWEER